MPQIPQQQPQQPAQDPVLLRLARYLWGFGGRWLRIAIFVAVGALLLILVAALTGVSAFVALTALAPLVAILLVPARINPMWLLAIAAWPDRAFDREGRRILPDGIPLGGDSLRRGVRWIIALTAVEVGMAFYYAGVEYLAPSVDRTLVLVTFALFVFLALVAASPTGKVRTRTLGVLSIVFVVLTVLFLFGGKDEFGNKIEAIGDDDAKAAPAERQPAVLPQQTTAATVTLPEDGSQSVPINTNDTARFPIGYCLQFDGPSDETLVYKDGVEAGRIADVNPERAVYHFAYAGGGEVDALVRPNC